MSKCCRCHKFFIVDETKVPVADDTTKFTHESCEARDPPQPVVYSGAAALVAQGLPLPPAPPRHCAAEHCIATQRWGLVHCKGCRGEGAGCSGDMEAKDAAQAVAMIPCIGFSGRFPSLDLQPDVELAWFRDFSFQC
jgi:hypothetical protein